MCTYIVYYYNAIFSNSHFLTIPINGIILFSSIIEHFFSYTLLFPFIIDYINVLLCHSKVNTIL